METAYFRPVNDFRSPAPRAPRCRPEVDDDDVIEGSATLLDENEEWAKVSNELCFYIETCILLARAAAKLSATLIISSGGSTLL